MTWTHNINKWSYIITLFPFICLFWEPFFGLILGLMAQFLLGLIQFGIAIRVSIESETEVNQRELRIYWIGMVSYLAIFTFSETILGDASFLQLLYYIIIPRILGGYLVHITSKANKSKITASIANTDEP